MHDHMLIAVDGSELADKAAVYAFSLARKLGARVTAVVVTEAWSVLEMAQKAQLGQKHPIESYEDVMAKSAQHVLDRVTGYAAEAGVPCTGVHVRDESPAEAIVAAADERGCDLIVMASHGRRGLNRLLLGSQTARVLALTKTPVLVYR
ncbi:MAG: universal stress protein [Hyphomicrobiales bacterium]|nr:universal stress protein [Hyphomicrobiales bacterium]